MTQTMRLSAPGRASCIIVDRHPLGMALAALMILLSGPACLAAVRPAPSVEQFHHAQALRNALEATPAASRTSADYERVLDAYRAVYHADPQSSKADESIVAVAQLLAEKGRTLHQARPLQQAILQYEFLRNQYPHSPYRFSALLTEGSIYLNDLGDRAQAKDTFLKFLRLYPSQPLASQAQAQLNAIDDSGKTPETAAAQLRRGATAVAPQSAAVSSQSAAAGAKPSVGEPAEASQPAPQPRVEQSAAQPDTVQRVSQPDSDRDAAPKTLLRIRYWSTANSTRIAINLDGRVPYKYAHLKNPNRIYYDLENTSLAQSVLGSTIAVSGSSFLQRIRTAQFSHNVTRIVLNVGASTDSYAFYLPNPWRLIIDLHTAPRQRIDEAKGATTTETGRHNAIASAASAPTIPLKVLPATTAPAQKTRTRRAAPEMARHTAPAVPSALPKAMAAKKSTRAPATAVAAPESSEPGSRTVFTARRATPTSNGKPSLVRTLGLKINRIVIDPGHGGYDSGTLGPGGIEEKDVVLDVALRLGKLLEQELGEQVIYTRSTDVFIPLEERTAIANRAHADLFISIHANSSSDKSVRGVECYYLNFTTDPDALKVAARENAVSNEQINQLSNLIKKIALSDKVEESREFALDVQKSLYDGLRNGNPGLKNRGVKRAPFVVLIGARMPSILAEISFLTNSSDASEMRRPAYRERIAESLFEGIAEYIRGLSGIRLAQYAENPDAAPDR